jgi:NTE family protein
MDIMSRVFSPYDLMPFDINPLRDILAETIHFDRLSQNSIKLFVTATNVSTGKIKVFRNQDLTPDVLLASACLPTFFKAVKIDNEYYWDGGYSGNPTITPLVRECHSSDTILIQINPVKRRDIPQTARDILNRQNEIAFNAVLLKELRMIAMLRDLAHPTNSEGAKWASMRIHRISSDIMLDLSYSSKLNAEWDFLMMLRDEGRRAAETFLNEQAMNLGKRSSLDLDTLLEGV